jgi:head-tail adaptor
MLRPETQDLQVFIDSVDVMVSTHQRVAASYLADGTITSACPPVRALLQIMASGTSQEGYTLTDERFRALFTRQSVLDSDWYAARLDALQAQRVASAEAGIAEIEHFIEADADTAAAQRLSLSERLAAVRAARDHASTGAARQALIGSLGRQPSFR